MLIKELMGVIRIGTKVYCKVGSNRSKEVVWYEGPFTIIVIREHNIVTTQIIREHTKVGHTEQLNLLIVKPEKA